MSRGRTYLDWNATAPLRPEAREAMLSALDLVGNPSSVHGEGRKARAVVEDAREAIARGLRVRPADVFFTSGATEGAAWTLTPDVRRRDSKAPLVTLLAGATEHACVLQGHRFPTDRVETLDVDGEGVVEVGALEATLARHGEAGVMVAVQAANNETGVLQPTTRIAELAHATGAVFVCDAVQLAGRAPCTASAFGGATLVVAGLQVPLLIVGSSAGSLIPALLTLVLTLIGVSWQLSNAAHWGHPILHDPLADKAQQLHPK